MSDITKIDFDHWLGNSIGQQILNNEEDKWHNENLRGKLLLIEHLKPSFSLDGNQYCYLYGELPNDCVIGFGSTPFEAMNDFVNDFYKNNPKEGE